MCVCVCDNCSPIKVLPLDCYEDMDVPPLQWTVHPGITNVLIPSSVHWNGNERQKIRHYHDRSTEERRRKKKNAKLQCFTSRGAYVNCAI